MHFTQNLNERDISFIMCHEKIIKCQSIGEQQTVLNIFAYRADSFLIVFLNASFKNLPLLLHMIVCFRTLALLLLYCWCHTYTFVYGPTYSIPRFQTTFYIRSLRRRGTSEVDNAFREQTVVNIQSGIHIWNKIIYVNIL